MKRRAGFTLIELLIVMAIIATLMAVLVPTATGAIRKARATKIAVQLRNLEQGLEQYLMATLPPTSDVDGKDLSYWKDKLEKKGFVDDDLLTDPNLKTLTTSVTNNETQIEITIGYDVKDESIAELVVGSLRETYGNGVSQDQNQKTVVNIKKTIEAFWW
ncbi:MULTISPECIES: type II secretion system protein [unclassified Thermotoga]|uniref:type II secretion system protein n=1 Tax=unclassified Thermotoga TaxID=2631113 RepID=UPI00054299D2|nr:MULTISPECIES: type II secretion system protein [unclassified Thermotoga]KHC92962.1 type IV pilin-related protein [Thermotoga sp. TBGT1765]KHC94370.1 type IV pilin-related protein [Thermotoga sp. TBGT1766]